MIISVPPIEETPWPTLGPLVVAWMENSLVFGPGDLRGEPYRLDAEKKALIYRAYEVFPEGHADGQGRPIEGRRRFRRVAVSLQKGSAKSELAAAIAAAELHPDAPVRCSGFRGGRPIGKGVVDPYVPMVAYTEEQTEDLAYYALRVMIGEGPLVDDFDIGLARVMLKSGKGKAVALAAAPDARDGARTTFEHFDETHRFTLDRLRAAHRTMLANLPKRRLADAWALETTTAPSPGEGSVAEATMTYARSVLAGKVADSRLFFFHRQASDGHDLATVEGIRAAVIEAAGPTAPWKDIEGIVEQWQDPTADFAYLERVWLNRPMAGSAQAFDVGAWTRLVRTERPVQDGDWIVLGFDGSRWQDSTALVATHVESGYMWLLGIWERPVTPSGRPTTEDWEVPQAEVEALLDEAFRTWNVYRMYGDPSWWETQMAEWAGRYGEDVIVPFRTIQVRKIAFALKSLANAIKAGEVSHDGNPVMTRHLGNARRNLQNFEDEDGERIWLIQKERHDSPNKIDAAMAAALSWQARNDAKAAGIGARSVYDTRGLLVFGESEADPREMLR